jgi:integrase
VAALKHLPVADWPEEDLRVFDAAFAPGDIFDDDRGPGAHLAPASRRTITTAYRRWLGFLNTLFVEDLRKPPADRITPARVRDYVEHLTLEVQSVTVSINIAGLHYAARLIAPTCDWSWLRALKGRLDALAPLSDRFDHLIPGRQTLDFGIELMEEALCLPQSARKKRITQYRDGLLIALLSVWPIRRRSLASLTIEGHIEIDEDCITILLHAEDTKSKRPESFRLPDLLIPYMTRYLDEIRPMLPGSRNDNGLWASFIRGRLSGQRIYDTVRARIRRRFGKEMNLHDFRRAAATFIALDAPEKVGLIPGVLQHASPDTSDQHYNLSRSIAASRRYASTVTDIRMNLIRNHVKKGGGRCVQ